MADRTDVSLLTEDAHLEKLDEDVSESSASNISPPEPATSIEPSNTLFLALMLFGCSFLVPWNSFLAAIDYLQLVYPNQRVEFDFSISYMLPNVIGLIIGLFIGPKYSVNARLGPGFIVYFLVLITAPFIGSYSLPYGVLIILLALSGLSDAVVQTGGQGYAGSIGLPQAIQAGLGSSGVLASSLRIVTKLMLPNDTEGLQRSSTIYFIIANLIVVAGVLAYLWTRRQPQVQALMAAHALHQSGNATDDTESWRSKVPVNVFPVAKQLWQPLLTIFVTFMITISLFPGTLVQITSSSESLNAGFWFPVLNIFFWNLFDFIGKFLPRWPRFSHKTVPLRLGYIICILRVLFFPIFITAAKNVWKADLILIPLIMIFGGTNGWLGSYFITYGNDIVELVDRETATLLGNTAIVGGLMVGSIVSIALKHIFF